VENVPHRNLVNYTHKKIMR